MPVKAYWKQFEKRLAEAAEVVVSVAEPALHGSYWWGSSDEFVRELRRCNGDLSVPEREILPLVDRRGGRPWDEAPLAAGTPCPNCGSIEPGSNLYCPKCQASGHDAALGRQRKLAGTPPPNPPEPKEDRWVPEADRWVPEAEVETTKRAPVKDKSPRPTRRQRRAGAAAT